MLECCVRLDNDTNETREVRLGTPEHALRQGMCHVIRALP